MALQSELDRETIQDIKIKDSKSKTLDKASGCDLNINTIRKKEKKVYSQFGEDDVLEFLF